MYVGRKYSPWMNDEEFVFLLNEITGITVIDPYRLWTLSQFCKYGKLIAGDVAEVGVYKGGSLYLLSRMFSKETTIYGFDTFRGIPGHIADIDSHQAGEYSDTSIAEVKHLIGSEYPNVKIIGGIFPSSGRAILSKKKFSLVHVDCDTYQSVMDCCGFFYSKMKRGGVIVFDDYGFEECKGAKSAIDTFFKGKDEHVLYLTSGQAVIIKR